MKKRHNTHTRDTVCACLALLIVVVLFCVCSYMESHYHRDATVISVEHQLVTVEDKCGYLWEFYADGYRVGDEVRMLMDTHCTDNIITDDEIIDVKLR